MVGQFQVGVKNVSPVLTRRGEKCFARKPYEISENDELKEEPNGSTGQQEK